MASPVVLMYHRICRDEAWRPSAFVVTATAFRRQMSWLSRHGYYTPRVSDVLRDGGRAPCVCGRPVVITFDDGYADVLEHAVPILRSVGFTAAVFPVLDLARRFNHWDDAPALSGPLLAPDELRAVEREGLELGSHTMTHARLTAADDDALAWELARSREVLAGIATRPLAVLAYPYGEVDDRVKRAAREAGYEAALAVNSGPLDWGADPFEVRRQRVGNGASDAYLRLILSGAEKLFAWSKWKVRRGLASVARHAPAPALHQG
ncbi:MAG TPA: polysaccharide deacetylase family protein [Anaeromyxobacter sp.]|nr:polysaccharide deacetylase family protein [Anaeromyxobacter sp.]